ncbi:IS3 family transposase [Companilactobacillus sp.]
MKQLCHLINDYTDWYNNERISLYKNGLTSIEYTNQAIAA